MLDKRKKREGQKISLNTNFDIAYDFATKAYQKFREVIKSIVLFGSVSKNQDVKESDIDIVIVIDDASVAWDQELIAWYREELGKLITAQNYNKEIHINTVTLTAFWEEVKAGTPVIMNIIRYGQPLVDFGGFFDPLKVLLAKGRIKPSPEAVFTTMKRAPEHLARARLGIISSIENIYWAMVDSSHSALMAANQIPPSPEHIPEMLSDVFVKDKVLSMKYVDYFNDIYKLTKNLAHGSLDQIKTEQVDEWLKKATDFEQVMRNIASKLIENEKIIMVKRNENITSSDGRIKTTNKPETKLIEIPKFNLSMDEHLDEINRLKIKNRELNADVMKYKSYVDDLRKQSKQELGLLTKSNYDQVLRHKKDVELLQKQIISQNRNITALRKQNEDLYKKNLKLKTSSKMPKLDSNQLDKTIENKNKITIGNFQKSIKKLNASSELLTKEIKKNRDLGNMDKKVFRTENTDKLIKIKEPRITRIHITSQKKGKKKVLHNYKTKKKTIQSDKKIEIEFPEYNPK